MEINCGQVFKLIRDKSFCLLCIVAMDQKEDKITCKLSEIINPSEIEEAAMNSVGRNNLDHIFVTRAGIFYSNYHIELSIDDFNSMNITYYCDMDPEDFLSMLRHDLKMGKNNPAYYLELSTFDDIYKSNSMESVAKALTKKDDILAVIEPEEEKKSFPITSAFAKRVNSYLEHITDINKEIHRADEAQSMSMLEEALFKGGYKATK